MGETECPDEARQVQILISDLDISYSWAYGALSSKLGKPHLIEELQDRAVCVIPHRCPAHCGPPGRLCSIILAHSGLRQGFLLAGASASL